MWSLILYILAAIFFAFDAFRWSNDRIAWTPAAFCLITIATFII